MAKPPRPEQLDEATRWFRERVPMRKETWAQLEHRAQLHGFTAAGVTRLALMRELQRAVERAVRKGITIEQFQREVGPKLIREWAGTVANPSARMENIFRTNTQRAYSGGRVRQMRDPSVMAARPWWTLMFVLDKRTSDICKTLSRVQPVLPANHPWWRTHTPPLHFQCRTIIRNLSTAEAEKLGVTKRAPTSKKTRAMEGFGTAEEYKPPLKGLPKGVAQAYRTRAKAAPTRSKTVKTAGRQKQAKTTTIKAVPVGRRTKHTTTEDGRTADRHNYSHMLSGAQLKEGYRAEVLALSEPRLGLLELASGLYDKKKRYVGEVNGAIRKQGRDVVLYIDTAELKPEHRGRGLGQPLYEATIAHAVNHLGVTHVAGGTHSSQAMAAHVRLAAKYGFDYRPKVHEGRENSKPGPFDARFKPYKYRVDGKEE